GGASGTRFPPVWTGALAVCGIRTIKIATLTVRSFIAHLLVILSSLNPQLLLCLSENRKVRNITRCDLAAYLSGLFCLLNQHAEAIFRQTSVPIKRFPHRIIGGRGHLFIDLHPLHP